MEKHVEQFRIQRIGEGRTKERKGRDQECLREEET